MIDSGGEDEFSSASRNYHPITSCRAEARITDKWPSKEMGNMTIPNNPSVRVSADPEILYSHQTKKKLYLFILPPGRTVRMEGGTLRSFLR